MTTHTDIYDLTLTISHEPHSFYDGFADRVHFSVQSTFREFAGYLAAYAADRGIGWDTDSDADSNGVTGLLYRNGLIIGYWTALRNV